VTRIRVLIVDDSVVIRRLVSDVLSGDPGIEVVGTAPNGKLALTKLAQLAPDLLTMDIEMPEMDGISAVRAMRASGSKLPVIMFSTLTERGASATLDALEAGASDYVTKPANVGSVAQSMEQVRAQLIPKIKALLPRGGTGTPGPVGIQRPLAGQPGLAGRAGAAAPGAGLAGAHRAGRTGPVETAARVKRDSPYRLLAVGCSTGGPEALSRFLAGFPADLPVPVVVVQHMPPVFTRQFAGRLDRQHKVRVLEAAGGEVLEPGTVYIAPGDFHLELVARGAAVVTRLQQGPPENFCRPAVDVLFRSAATVFGGDVLGVVLTGMGADGRRGSEQLVARGSSVVVQDEATSVVWGMPGAVAGAGLAEEVLALDDLGPAVLQRLQSLRGVGRAPALSTRGI
jgi:two-component system, chemotaxis family, protein-glutamate methylesterase/glutaminase